MEKCANCERSIGNLEPAHVLNNAIVCDACYQRLCNAPASAGVRPALASPPYTPTPSAAPKDDLVSTMIPYRNGYALASYYIGLFSLFPCIGAIMGIVAVILGIKGLKIANANPAAKGKAHAIVGIVCGLLFGLGWILLDAGILFGLIMSARHPR